MIVVGELSYKLEGRGFESIKWTFFHDVTSNQPIDLSSSGEVEGSLVVTPLV